MAREKARVKRKERKNISTGVCHVNASFNNTKILIADAQGNAIALAPRAAGTRALAEAVRRLLGDESFRLAAGRVRDAYATEDGAAACARSIESTLTG